MTSKANQIKLFCDTVFSRGCSKFVITNIHHASKQKFYTVLGTKTQFQIAQTTGTKIKRLYLKFDDGSLYLNTVRMSASFIDEFYQNFQHIIQDLSDKKSDLMVYGDMPSCH